MSLSQTQGRVSALARLSMNDAFERLRAVVSVTDARSFDSTTLLDVYEAALTIEREQSARRSLRNTRRLKPFLDGLQRYTKCVDILCNGTPYLPWIWAPVRLLIQLASDYASAFDKLLAEYRHIADVLPRFDRLSEAFRENPDFQHVLAMVYVDILAFHEKAYKFFCKPGWKTLFSSTWCRFDDHFKAIRESLAKNCDLVDRSAASIDISEAKAWRKRALDEAIKRENDTEALQRQSVLSWLNLGDSRQEDELEAQLRRSHPNTCQWITRDAKMRAWMRNSRENKVLWLKGKPGSGKTVICSNLVHFLRQDRQNNVLFYFCNGYRSHEINNPAAMLQSFCCQLLQSHIDLSSYMFDEYVSKGLSASWKTLLHALQKLLTCVEGARIILDGIDEWDLSDVKRLFTELMELTDTTSPGNKSYKVLISSRDVPQISNALSKRPTVSLSKEKSAIDAAIRIYTQASISDLLDRRCLEIDPSVIQELENSLVDKSDGMFLWVRLVLNSLEDAYSIQELREAVDSFPSELLEVYARIIEVIRGRLGQNGYKKAIRVLGWMAFSKRPLKTYELQYGVALHAANTRLNQENKPFGNITDICKPLAEDGIDQTIVFVHFSVKEFLLSTSKEQIVNPLHAQQDISFACVAYMVSAFELINPELCAINPLIRVGEGYHSLFLYANRFWFEHLLDYVALEGPGVRKDRTMLAIQLLELCKFYIRHSTHEGGLETESSGITVSDERLGALIEWGDIYLLVRITLSRREALLRKQKTTKRFGVIPDESLFGRMAQNYFSYVKELLGAISILGLSTEVLSQFRALHSTTINVCSYHGCERETLGFASTRELERHKMIHAPEYVCLVPSCDYSVIGFKTLVALRRHTLNYHSTQTTSYIPRTLRRRRQHLVPKPLKESFLDEPQLDGARADPDGKKKRKMKGPNGPSRPLSASMFFENENRDMFREDPSLRSNTWETSKVVDMRWKEMSDRERAPYEAIAAADKKRYEKETALFNSQT